MTKENDLLTVEGIKNCLTTRFIGTDIYIFDNIDSTNEYAMRLAREGALDGTVVLADSQDKGKGRLGRSWFSPRGVNLYLSVVLRPKTALEHITLITFASAIALVRAINDIANIEAHIKWPNDVLINNKKAAGILTEANTEANKLNFCVIGMGINVNLNINDLPLDLRDKATSIMAETEKAIDRTALLCSLLKHIEDMYNILTEGYFNRIIEEWKSLAITLGRDVMIQSGNKVIEGIAVDIDSNGALLVTDRNGIIQRVLSGDVI